MDQHQSKGQLPHSKHKEENWTRNSIKALKFLNLKITNLLFNFLDLWMFVFILISPVIEQQHC